jgi:hypothetical protein
MAVKLDGTLNALILDATSVNYLTLKIGANTAAWTMTFPTGPGAAGQVLTTDGSGVLSWGAGSSLPVINDTSSIGDRFPLFANATTGTLTQVYTASPEYTYNPDTGNLTAPHAVSSSGIALNANTITASYTIPAGNNGLSAGTINVPAGIVVTAPAGTNWVVV